MATFLVIQAARFGDLVQSKRLVCSLAQKGAVHLVVDTSLTALARLLYPFAAVHGLVLHGSPDSHGLDGNRAVLARLRAAQFDNVYNCNFSGLTAALCRMFAPERVHGYRWQNGSIARSPWAKTVFRLSQKRWASPLNLVDFWAYFAPEPVAPRSVAPVARAGGQGLGVVLSGREVRRSLSAPLLASIVTTVFGALGGVEVRLLGTAAEQPAARRLRRLLPPNVQAKALDLSGKTDWPGLIDAMRGLDALITPDTGSMHLATHLGVPVLAFFLSSAWCHETGPYGQGHYIWQASTGCAPCLESAPCPNNLACHTPFERRELLRSVAAVLSHNATAPPLGADLQLWRSDVDALGAVPQLLAGEDPHAALRGQARDFLASRLHLPHVQQKNSGTEVQHWLVDDTDWILPPERYS